MQFLACGVPLAGFFRVLVRTRLPADSPLHLKKGEVIEVEGLKFEVLDSTDRRVERARITTVEPKQMKLI
jgi:hypothetical protein